ncbi:MAG: glycosyltransferase family 2 protein [Alphaproteobacteria bacterium]|nr:glycosyltransferase family 2 protein [Alphaproteobacteria bacterium]
MISVVIPAFDEEGAIAATVETARTVLERAGLVPCEIVVVDDGSTDRTGEIAAAAGARVVRHVQNLGYGKALKSGIAAASHEIVAITDADGTYPIDRIPELVALHRRGFDMAVAQRTGDHYRESLFKMPLRWALKRMVEFAAGRSIPDINSGLRVFARATVLPYFRHLCNTFSFTTSLTLAYMMNDLTVAYLPVAYHKRIGRTKVRLVLDSARTLQYIVQAILYYDPIKIFLLLCGACVALAGVSLVFGFIFQIHSAFLLAVGSLVIAIVVFALGLLADLLKQVINKPS